MKLHDCRKTQQQMSDWLFDEASPTVPAELAECQSCLDQYFALQAALQQFDQAAVAMMPAPEYWAGYEARLRVKLADEAAPSRWLRWFHRPLWLIPVAAVLLLLFFGLGWSQRRAEPASEAPSNEVAHVTAPKPGAEQEKESDAQKQAQKRRPKSKPERKEPSRPPDKKPYLLTDPNPILARTEAAVPLEVALTTQHVERAQRLLRSFRNSQPGNQAVFDLAYEKKQARRLLYENILLRREAETRGDWPLEELLSNLEPLLLDIGNLPARPTTDDVQPIIERVQKKELVARLQLYASPVIVALAD